MRIAVFGGSFDPIHIAHVAIVKNALNSLNIDKLIVVPTYLNPFKTDFHLEPKFRFKLLKKIFLNYKKVEICDFEINQNKSTYSIETIKYLKKLYNPTKIYFIIGEDNLENLDKWHKIDDLKEFVEFVVASRSSFKNENTKTFKTLDIDIDISSTALRENIDLKFIPLEIKDDIINLQKKEKGKDF